MRHILGFALSVAGAIIRAYLVLLAALLMALGRAFASLVADAYAESRSRRPSRHSTSDKNETKRH